MKGQGKKRREKKKMLCYPEFSEEEALGNLEPLHITRIPFNQHGGRKGKGLPERRTSSQWKKKKT